MTKLGKLNGSAAAVLILLFAAASMTAQARITPVYNIVDKPILTGSGHTLSAEEVGGVLQEAAEFKHWSVAKVEDGYLKAEIQVRQHFAAIDIHYTSSTYSISYRDSRELMYDGSKIHRNYNKWIQLIEQKAEASFAAK